MTTHAGKQFNPVAGLGRVLAAATMAVMAALASAADDQPAPPAPPAPAPPVSGRASEPTEQPKPDQPASLDDLLGIPGQPKKEGEQAPAQSDAQAGKEELERALNEGDMDDWFALALEKMGAAADLLDVSFDPGLETQRVQEEILARLDRLLDAAEQQRGGSSSSGSSSSSSSSSTSRSGTPPKSQPKDSQGQPGSERGEKAQDSQEGSSPPLRQGDIDTILDETRQEWGNLPQRVRDMMLQGQTGKFSTLYQKLTQEYYKRLAEEGS